MIKIDMAIFEGLGLMSMVSVIAMVIVLIAMAVDLVSGVHKAKMYDKVSGQLFGNAGTGDFIVGPDKN